MSETIVNPAPEVASLQERVKKIAEDKAYLQLVIRLMNRVNAVAGLENVTANLLQAIGEVIGGVDLVLYYVIDEAVYYTDIAGRTKQVAAIDDDLVKQVFATSAPVERERPFVETQMATPEFSKAYTWGIPLVVGADLIGVLKVENLHIAMKELSGQLPTFFNYAALILKNEISEHSRLKKAYDALEHEVAVRRRAEADLRQSNRVLEARVAERTARLQEANARLLENEKEVRRLLENSESSRRALLSILEDERQAKDALKVSEERFRALFENSPIAIWEEDLSAVKKLLDVLKRQNGGNLEPYLREHPEVVRHCVKLVRIIDVNQAALALHGANSKEELFRGLANVFTPESYETFRNELIAVANGEMEAMGDAIVRTLDGERRDVIIQFAVCPGHENTFSKALVSVVDITERKRAEQELSRTAEEWQTTFDSIADMVSIQDAQFRVLRVNKAYAEAVGARPEDITGKKCFEIVHEANCPIAGCPHAETIETGEARVREVYEAHLDAHLEVSTSPVFDAAGKVVGSIHIAKDVTRRKRIENIHRARLRLLELASSYSVDEFLTATLDEIETLTGSEIGFYHFLDADQETLLLQNWSSNTLENMCAAEGKGSHYSVDQAGVWVDCIHQRRPVIHNDYASLPHRKGMPPGHAPVIREVVVPIFRGNLIKAIIGVGNKSTDYGENDIEVVSQLGDVSWDIVEKMLAEDALRRSEYEKSILNEIANNFLTTPDEAIFGDVLDTIRNVLKSAYGFFGYIGENGDLVVPSLTREVWTECQVPEKSITFPHSSWGDTVWARAIREKKTLCSEGSFSTPEGHIPIKRSLVAPIIFGQDTIGVLAAGNKDGGYTEEDKRLLERIAAYISPILNARLQRDEHERTRLKVEEALRESEEKYRLLVASANEAIFIIQDGVVKFPNRSTLELSGCTERELAETPFSELIHREDRDEVVRKHDERLRGQRLPEIYPFRIVRKNGETLWVQVTATPITWEGRLGTLCFLQDVTKQKALEAQFLQSQKMEAVGRLAGGVAHDFNNMLLVINGFAELALGAVHEGDLIWDQLHEIRRAGEQAAAVTRQLLAFSRKQVQVLEVLDMNAVVANVGKMLKRLIGEDIALVLDPEEQLWAVRADRGQIEQAIINLAVNARDAMPGGGRLTIQTENVELDEQFARAHLGAKPGPHVMLSVMDTGCGMDNETVSRIFEPFFTTKEKGKGTGLGLATVYGVVQQSGGNIWVHSEIGRGTTFRLCFPRVEERPAEETAQRPPVSPGLGETVLVVEDEEAVRRLIVHVLGLAGYKVLEAGDGEDGLRLSDNYSERIGLLITDMVMPHMGGPELAVHVRESRRDAKVLFMSGYSEEAIVHDGVLGAGAHFIQKPFGADELLAKVREVLEHK